MERCASFRFNSKRISRFIRCLFYFSLLARIISRTFCALCYCFACKIVEGISERAGMESEIISKICARDIKLSRYKKKLSRIPAQLKCIQNPSRVCKSYAFLCHRDECTWWGVIVNYAATPSRNGRRWIQLQSLELHANQADAVLDASPFDIKIKTFPPAGHSYSSARFFHRVNCPKKCRNFHRTKRWQYTIRLA